MSPNRTVGELYRLDRACAERLAGLADKDIIHHLLQHTGLHG